MEGDGPADDAVAFDGGDDHHEAVPVGAECHSVHHFSPECLDRVEVGYPHPEEHPRQPVVNPGDKCLLVGALLGAGDHVGAALEDWEDQLGNVLGEVLEIGGIEDEDVAPGDLPG